MANFKGYIYKFTSTIDPIKCYIGKNITKCCLGKNKTSIGYIWKYKEE
jgi:hypothetical protein